MAVNITQKPFVVDFIQNDAKFVFKGENIQVAGSKTSVVLFIVTQPAVGKKFTIKINDKEFEYTITSTLTNDIHKLYYNNNKINDDDLLRKLAATKYIADNFTFVIDYGAGVMRLSFSSKKVGKYTFEIHKDSSFNAFFSYISSGQDRIYRPNYKVWVRFNFLTAKSTLTALVDNRPEILLDVDENGYATLPLDILKKISKGIDIPTIVSSNNQYIKYGATILNGALVQYYFDYSEVYGGEIKWLKKSSDFYAINGANSTSGASLNRPDWFDIFPATTIEKQQYARLFGCDNSKTYQTHLFGRDFLYLCLFDTTKDVNHKKTIKCKIEILLKNGMHASAEQPDITITNYSIVRIPAYIDAFFNMEYFKEILQYKIILWNSDAVNNLIERTYIINEVSEDIHQFLFQNKYGVLEYFYAENQKIELNSKGNVIVNDNIKKIDITEQEKKFTIKTGAKSYNQLKILEQAAKSEHNYLIKKDKLIPIYIIPESITILDETKDLQETSFSYSLRDNNNEDIIPYYATKLTIIENQLLVSEEQWHDTNQQEQTNIWDDRNKFNETKITNLYGQA